MQGVTFDTAALIALERGDKRMRTVWKAATEDRLRITAPRQRPGSFLRPDHESAATGGAHGFNQGEVTLSAQ